MLWTDQVMLGGLIMYTMLHNLNGHVEIKTVIYGSVNKSCPQVFSLRLGWFIATVPDICTITIT